MGTILQLPAFPRHGILLNPSPTASPYNHPSSLPGTPHLISSLSSLSSSASSSSPHNSEADNYFLQSVPARDGASSVPRNGAHTPSTNGTASNSSTIACRDAKKLPQSAPQTRKIRFAPLPEPRREEDLPDVFLDDDVESITSLPLSASLDIPRAHTSPSSSRPSSLLFSGGSAVSEAPSDTSTATVTPAASSSHLHHAAPLQAVSSTSGSERYDSDVDPMTPQSTAAVLSSSSSFIERCSQSCPESPIGRRVDLPPRESRKWTTKKLLKPFLGPLSKRELSTEDVLTLGLSQLYRSSTRDSDGVSSGTTTPARNRSRERPESISGLEDADFGVPLSRSTSENTHVKPKCPKKKSLLSSLLGSDSNSSGDGALWRTQSANAEMRRSKSRESTIANEDLRRTRSSSAGGATARPARKQLRMLNGRVYGAKRNTKNNVNLFATARSDPEFVEWGYGGMGSVKSADSVGNNKYSRVQGSAALGSAEGAGWGHRGRTSANDDDDGGGMAWVKRRKEARERAQKEAAEKAAAEAAAQETKVEVEEKAEDKLEEEKPSAVIEAANPDQPVSTTVEQVEEARVEPVETEERSTPIAVSENADHVTTAVKVPIHSASPRHHSINLGHHPHGHPMRMSAERTPSFASRHSIPRTPERRSSTDTTTRVTSPVPQNVITDAQEIVGELEGLEEQREEEVEAPRERRESQSSTSSASEDEDADAEYSPKEEDDSDDEEELTSKTALGAGVEKISRHKSSHSQDGVTSPGA